MNPKQVTVVCEASQKFSKLFYENYDKDRNKLKGFYLENAQLVWNGNPVSNRENILKFLTDLPSSVIEVASLDAQVGSETESGGRRRHRRRHRRCRRLMRFYI